MVIVQGYKIDTQDVNEIELCLQEMQNKIKSIATEKYHVQLSHEIEVFVDNIALNIQPRPNDMSILDVAKMFLDKKIAYATARQNRTEYNYYVSVNVMFHDDKTFLKFNANNNIYKKALASIKGLHPYYLEDSVNKNPDIEREGIWKFLMEKYSNGTQPLSVQLFPCEGFKINQNALKFKTPNRRASIIARHNLTNRYLSMIANEQEIPPYKLMEYIDEAMELLTTPEGKAELNFIEADLKTKNILPIITTSMITMNPTVLEQPIMKCDEIEDNDEIMDENNVSETDNDTTMSDGHITVTKEE